MMNKNQMKSSRRFASANKVAKQKDNSEYRYNRRNRREDFNESNSEDLFSTNEFDSSENEIVYDENEFDASNSNTTQQPEEQNPKKMSRFTIARIILLVGLVVLTLIFYVYRVELSKIALIGVSGVVLGLVALFAVLGAYIFCCFAAWIWHAILKRKSKLPTICSGVFGLVFCGWIAINSVAPMLCDEQIDNILAKIPPATSQELYIRRGNKEERVLLAAHRRVTVDELEKSPLLPAVPVIEDERLGQRWTGVFDIEGIGRAIKNKILYGKREGASPIIVQAGKWIRILNGDQKFHSEIDDKFWHYLLAIRLEQRFPDTKEQIALYLSLAQVDGNYNMAYAAVDFFDAPISELNLEQSALLAGILNNPTFFHPRKQTKNATARRNTVLDKMQEFGLINDVAKRKTQPLQLADAMRENQKRFYIQFAKKGK